MANEKNSSKNYGIRERTHDRVDKIMDRAELMRDSSKRAIARIKEKAINMRGNVDSYIEKNPEKSVLIAAGVGAVVATMFVAVMMRRRA